MSLSLLAKQPLTWDSDASSYITSVENADTTSLEPAVARAINTFVIDCKIRGIWGAIKSSCLLCGARTLNGALIPLKGTAPTSYNFVSSDYNRESGLKGGDKTALKYLNSNRLGNIDSQNNAHMSIYVNTAHSSPGNDDYPVYIGYGGASAGSTMISRLNLNGNTFFRHRSSNLYDAGTNSGSSIGFMGISRSLLNNYTVRRNQSSVTISENSQSPLAVNIGIFVAYNSSNVIDNRTLSNGRLSFYSIGESLDLRLLEQCVNRFNLNLLYALRYNSSDSDVQNYLNQVESADNYPLENSIRLAIHNFVTGCKSDNIWNSIKASCLLSGARTLRAALIPLVGIAPNNFNFVESDYNRVGLLGNGSNKYLDSNRASNTDPQDNNHISCFVSTVPSIDGSYYMGVVYGASGTSYNAIVSNQLWNRNGVQSYTKTTGFHGTSRNSSTSFIGRVNSTSTTNTATSVAPNSDKYFIFARNVGYAQTHTNARLSFYSIGENLDLSLLDNRVTSLMSSINNTI